MYKEFGILFNYLHTYRDFGLILNKKEIGSPEVKKYEIDVPYRDGKIDVTEQTTGQVSYNNRPLKFTFSCIDPMNTWSGKYSNLLNMFHGQKMHVICDDDPGYYYVARLKVNQWESDKNIGKIVIEGDAEPYKYEINSSTIDWEWDIFDFEEGFINEANELIVSGERTVTLICRGKRMFPEFIISAPMTLTYKDETYSLVAGSQKIFDLFLDEGENVLTFKGNGTVTIDYIGGIL